MKFEKIKFKEASTQRVYEHYIQQIERIVETLPEDEQLDILMEMNSFIYEGMRYSDEENELTSLLNIIDNFGDLEKVLEPIVTERKQDPDTRTFNPIRGLKALLLNIQKGVFAICIAICYIGIVGLGISLLAKILFPDQIGMFYKANEYFVLAGVPGNGINELEYELLGDWYIPVFLLGMGAIYIFIALIMRFEQYLRKQTNRQMDFLIA